MRPTLTVVILVTAFTTNVHAAKGGNKPQPAEPATVVDSTGEVVGTAANLALGPDEKITAATVVLGSNGDSFYVVATYDALVTGDTALYYLDPQSCSGDAYVDEVAFSDPTDGTPAMMPHGRASRDGIVYLPDFGAGTEFRQMGAKWVNGQCSGGTNLYGDVYPAYEARDIGVFVPPFTVQ